MRAIYLPILPEDYGHVHQAVVRMLNSHKFKFYPDIGGIMMGYQGIRVKQSTSQPDPALPLHMLNLSAEFFIFRPLPGEELSCVVSRKEQKEVECLAHDMFTVRVVSPEPGVLERLWVGQEVVVRVEGVSHLAGQDLLVVGQVVQVQEIEEDSDSDSESGTDMERLESQFHPAPMEVDMDTPDQQLDTPVPQLTTPVPQLATPLDASGTEVRRSKRKPKSELLKEKKEEMDGHLLASEDTGLGLEVFLVEGKGRCVKTVRDLAKGEFVVEYAGELLDIGAAKDREANYSHDSSKGSYMYYFKHKGQQYCIDATSETARYGRLLNHSRVRPNVLPKVVMLGQMPRVVLVARQDIPAGTELLFDYGDR